MPHVASSFNRAASANSATIGSVKGFRPFNLAMIQIEKSVPGFSGVNNAAAPKVVRGAGHRE
jgi:hypothetical protein